MRLDGEDTEGFVLQRLSPDLQLKGAYFLRADTIEVTFAYRFTDSLSWEAVVTSRGLLYVSIVSNL
jgi:hypothetical protein